MTGPASGENHPVGRLAYLRERTEEAARNGGSVTSFADQQPHRTELSARVKEVTYPSDKSDYPPEKIAFQIRTPVWCRSQASEVGYACRAVIDQLLEVNVLYRFRAAQGVLGLRTKYGETRPEAACARTIAVGDPSDRAVKGIRIAGAETDPETSGDAGAAAFLHGPARLFATVANPTRRTTTTTTRFMTKPRWKPDDCDGRRPAGVTQGPATVRHAGNPRRPPRAGPRRRLATSTSSRSSARTRSPAARLSPSNGALLPGKSLAA